MTCIDRHGLDDPDSDRLGRALHLTSGSIPCCRCYPAQEQRMIVSDGAGRHECPGYRIEVEHEIVGAHVLCHIGGLTCGGWSSDDVDGGTITTDDTIVPQ